MSEELKPGIPRKPLTPAPARDSVEPDMSYVDMALGRQSSSLSESTDHTAELISGVKSLSALCKVLDGIKGIQGSKSFHLSATLIQHIARYVETGKNPNVITNGAGLFDKVEDLIQAEERRFVTFSAAVSQLDPEITLESFRRHSKDDIMRRDNPYNKHERIGIYYREALMGTVKSPTEGPFSVDTFKEEVRKLLESKGIK